LFLSAAKSDKFPSIEEIFKLPKTQFNPPFLSFSHLQHAHEATATNSASVVDSVIIGCFFEDQEMAPLPTLNT
jgi:hypothetical protein